MSLLRGFMMKEDRKPLTYITNGIVAINFCWRDKEKWQEQTVRKYNMSIIVYMSIISSKRTAG